MKKSKQLRELFNSGKVFTIAGGSCAFHAKMAEAAGFECAYMSGGFTSSFLLGIPRRGHHDPHRDGGERPADGPGHQPPPPL